MKTNKTWTYQYHFLKQFDWLYPLITVMVISELIMVFALFLASPVNLFSTLKELRFIFYMITGLFVLSALLTILFYKGGYTYRYVIENSELITTSSPLLADHQAQINVKIGHRVQLAQIKKLILDSKNNKIKIHGFLTITSVYADSSDFEEVWEVLSENCPQAQKIR